MLIGRLVNIGLYPFVLAAHDYTTRFGHWEFKYFLFSIHFRGKDLDPVEMEAIDRLQQAAYPADIDQFQGAGRRLHGLFIEGARSLVGDDEGLGAAADGAA